MVSPTERRLESSEYKENFYVEGQKLFCKFCSYILDHMKKFTLDIYLKSNKYISNIHNTIKEVYQITFNTYNSLNNYKYINITLVKIFT